MSTPQTDTLNQILTDVLANRKNLSDQRDQHIMQTEIAAAQLAKFDTLIATLQVVTLAPNVLEAVVQQEAANAIVSPTGAAAAANDTAATALGKPAEVVSSDPQVGAASSGAVEGVG